MSLPIQKQYYLTVWKRSRFLHGKDYRAPGPVMKTLDQVQQEIKNLESNGHKYLDHYWCNGQNGYVICYEPRDYKKEQK